MYSDSVTVDCGRFPSAVTLSISFARTHLARQDSAANEFTNSRRPYTDNLPARARNELADQTHPVPTPTSVVGRVLLVPFARPLPCFHGAHHRRTTADPLSSSAGALIRSSAQASSTRENPSTRRIRGFRCARQRRLRATLATPSHAAIVRERLIGELLLLLLQFSSAWRPARRRSRAASRRPRRPPPLARFACFFAFFRTPPPRRLRSKRGRCSR